MAPGATGKSFWALEAAMAIACSVAGGDLVGLSPPRAGRVIYYAGEDPEVALVRRIHAIGQHLNKQAREAIVENLILKPVMGTLMNVLDDVQRADLISFCSGARLIVLDTLSRIHDRDENSNSDMAKLIVMLEHIAACTGASVLYLHHVSKGSAREGGTDQQQAARGASALIDNARWCGFIAKMTEKEAKSLSDQEFSRQPIGDDRRGFFVRFGVSKQNYDAIPIDHWYKRYDGGVLVPVRLVNTRKESALTSVNGADDESW